MELQQLKAHSLDLLNPMFGKIVAFVDCGNVNYWYDKDQRDWEGNTLPENNKLIVDIEKLSRFTSSFCSEKRFYYGWNPRKMGNWHIVIKAERYGFVKNTKPMQFIRHDVGGSVVSRAGKTVKKDKNGSFIETPKGNFDVEICVDAIRITDWYDTFCLFSGDSDFAYLAKYLRKKGKKIIIVAAGHISHTLKEVADLYINAQDIKQEITNVKAIKTNHAP